MVSNPTDIPSDFTSEEGVNVAGDDAPEQGQDLLTQINQSTGRNYATLDEAVKGISETYKFVGSEVMQELRRKAKLAEQIGQKPLSESEKNDELFYKVDKMDFLRQFPNSDSIADMVGRIAKEKGISWKEAYQETEEGKKLKKLVEIEVKEREAAEPEFVGAGQRLPSGMKPISSEEFAKLSMEEQRAIVSKLPAWEEAVPKGHYVSKKRQS